MLKIGDFSKLTRVSIKMLRHYDDLGLLKPAHVDPFTGYRYYAADQLPRLNRIIALKDMGFSLEQIAYLLDKNLTADQLRGMLQVKRMEVEQRLREEQERLGRIESRLLQIEAETHNTAYDVVLREVASGIYATIRHTMDADYQLERLFDQAERYAAMHRARAAAPPLAIFYDAGYQESDSDVEIAIPLTAALPNGGGVIVREIPGTREMACVVHTGCYSTLQHASNALLLWVGANGYEVAGPLREVYLRFGADQTGYSVPSAYLAKESSELVTELQIPVKKVTGLT